MTRLGGFRRIRADDVWVQGARPPGDVRTGLSSFEHLYLRTVGLHREVPTGPTTSKSEQILGMPQSAYFYLAKCHPKFGDNVAVYFADKRAQHAQVLPFDTGGLAQGEIGLRRVGKASLVSPRDLYARHRMSLDAYSVEFRAWIKTAFTSVDQYVQGVVPSAKRVPDIVIAGGEDPRSWTWEVSVSKDCQRLERLRPAKVRVRTGTLEEFKDWLISSAALTEKQSRRYHKWLREHVEDSTDPVGDTLSELRRIR